MASQFSSDGKYFAQLSNEGKLKIWNTLTSSFEQEYTPDFHLTCPCTCLHFTQSQSITNKAGSPRKKIKRRESDYVSPPHVILGTSTGLLLAYSIAKADIDYKVTSNTSESINCLSWNSGNFLYSGTNQNILCWDLENRTLKNKWKSGNDEIKSILVISKGRLLTASRNIKLWDVKNQQLLKTFTGHSSEVSILEYVQPLENGDSYFVSGSKNDRLLSCWTLNEKSEEKNAVASFLMEDVACSVSVLVGSDNCTNMSAVTRSGVVHIYLHTLNGKCNKPLKPKTTIQIASDTGQDKAVVTPIQILGAVFQKDLSITICHGNNILLTFENVVVNTHNRIQCLVRSDPTRLGASKNRQASKIKTPATDNVHYLTPHSSSTLGTKRKVDGKQDVPMEQRLENLTLNKLESDSKVPKADNMAQLLIQGLHSKDTSILTNILSRKDETLIKNTVRRLPMGVVVPLIQELVKCIKGKTVWSQVGTLWLKHLVQIHAGLLLSNPELQDLLGPILGSIENRLLLQAPLSRLRGRLDLLLSQMKASKPEENDDKPLLVYNDKDSSDSEMEGLEIPAHSDSENEWMEEDSDEEKEQENDSSESQMST